MNGKADRSPAGRRGAWSLWALAWRYRLQALADAAIIAAATFAAVFFRMEFQWSRVDLGRTAAMALVAAAVLVATGLVTGLYAGRTRYASFDQAVNLATAMALTTATVAVLNRWVLDRLVPVSASIVLGVFALLGSAAVRVSLRHLLELRRRPSSSSSERALVFGAGEAGAQVVTAMLRDPDSPYLPVGLLDDDPHKANLRLSGVPMVGRRDDLAAAAERLDAAAVVIALPSAGSGLIRELAREATEAGLRTMVLPPTGDLLDGRVGVGDIRPITEEDLLGRHRVETDVESIAGYVTGRRVLVTGAGGSIGSELCRQLHGFDPAELIMLDRDESGLHATQLSIDGRGLLETRALVVADIREPDRLDEVWAEWRPQVVFHAAALKHVPLLEMHPEEGHKTNVEGTRNVLDASARHGVGVFVNISTDKAADPINVLGRTKRQAELLTAEYARRTEGGTYVSVRFGNVLGSRGSVLTAFRHQIDAGGPVTVTHPEVTRYFMTVAEAVELVIQAGAIGRDGEVLILQMGEPVLIADVAQQMIDAAGKGIDIVFTGLREGEKLHEVLVGDGEEPVTRSHPAIMHVAGVRCDRSPDDAANGERTLRASGDSVH